MKKLPALSLILLLLAAVSAYAQETADFDAPKKQEVSDSTGIKLSGWGRGVVTPLAFSGQRSAVSASTYTSFDNPVIGFTVNGTAKSQKIGFKVDFAAGYDYGSGSITAGIGDNSKVWTQPWKPFRLTAGLFKEEDLRGKFSTSEFAAWILPNSGRAEDAIFQRFDAFAGAHFKIDPFIFFDNTPLLQGITLQGAFGSNAPGTPGSNIRAILNLFINEDNTTLSTAYDENYSEYDGERVQSALDVYKAMQFAVGWKIPEVGLARVQYIGNNGAAYRWGEQGSSAAIVNMEKRLVLGLNTNHDYDEIQAAFLLDAFEKTLGVKADAGFTLPLAYTTSSKNLEIYPRVVGTDGKAYQPIMNGNQDEYEVQDPYALAVAASYTPPFHPAASVTARVDASFGGYKKSPGNKTVETGSQTAFYLMPSYKITAHWKVGLDAGFETHAKDFLKQEGINPNKAQTDPSAYTDLGAALWGELSFEGGRFRAGLSMMLPGSPRYTYTSSSATYTYSPKYTGDPVIAIPISFTYSF